MNWDTKLWLLAHLPFLGLWVLLFRTPMVAHGVWLVSRFGRRADQPVWNSVEFTTYLTMRGDLVGSLAASLWACNGCQSFHVAWMTGLSYGLQLGCPIWGIPVLILMCLPSALVGVRILSKI